ncbi:Immunoglobulin A1 protease [Wickerhamomyces ciferrii]|uniref:Immunoglobulin A1 protease n=1 Tax=Wickerhamomyces ciferrii (strain ATCC 14091 / BCRC 22168 / CBS 111 / JCM 3599 / NBRC 0793 / NRRL Y-1031 F-60-10) TaxID=1206466 RepID=K0K841_WICCF|nr:Immunoglobulin A1 protease [Wickerhamomyces ciferrii]CCH40990.1 Immunoglobulin A1 protease [Wickerhamomyces ciferrii]
MSLVQYSSSDDSSDDEQPTVNSSVKTTVNSTSNNIISKPTGSGTSISSFLPPPKNRQPPKKEPRVLGKAIKSIAGESQVNPDNIVLEKSSKQVTSFIPSSLRNKKSTPKSKVSDNETTTTTTSKIQEPKSQIELFQTIKSKPKPITSNHTKLEIRPIIDEPESIEPIITSPQHNEEHPNKKRSRGEDIPDPSNIKEFNVDKFYQENLELKDQGLLQENKKLHTITNHKNQLSALVKNAQQDGDLLNERIEHNKRLKKERGDKYGW